MTSSSTSSTATPNFSDISSHWAKACILALAEQRIVNGYPDGSFRPNASITRAEMAALMYVAFPDAPTTRQSVSFLDVPSNHWAHRAIRWAYERGFFSGYPDGNFQPSQPISRLQAVVVLVSTQSVDHTFPIDDYLQWFFDDAEQIPGWAKTAVADAIVVNIIVNYPNVRTLLPNQNATRGDVSALLNRTLKLPNVPPEYATWNWGIYDIRGTVQVPYATWKGSGRLMRDIQVLLAPFRLYNIPVDGKYNWETEKGLTEFCQFYGLPTMRTGAFDEQFAWSLLNADPVEFIMIHADRQKVYSEFLQQEAGYSADKLAFLDRGIQNSLYANAVKDYPDRLTLDVSQVASPGTQVTLTGSNTVVGFSSYPTVGTRPPIDGGLEFLHSDIIQACVCVGSLVNGKMHAHWRGRDAIKGIQQWSTTKIMPLIYVVCRANAVLPSAKVRDCLVRPAGSVSGYSFYNLAVEIVNYQYSIASSNAISAAFKQFSTPTELEGWVKRITGNSGITFQGRYGEDPFMQSPNLYHQPSARVVLNAPATSHTGSNLISAYDLTRFITMLGWHNHLPQGAQFPAAQWDSLETVVRAMGMDTARYLDVAIERLGLNRVIESPVILSKLGFGRSSSRNRTELGYVALGQFLDTRPRKQGKPPILRTFGLSLLGAKALNDANEEARQLDARMAAEVTELVRRIATQELA